MDSCSGHVLFVSNGLERRNADSRVVRGSQEDRRLSPPPALSCASPCFKSAESAGIRRTNADVAVFHGVRAESAAIHGTSPESAAVYGSSAKSAAIYGTRAMHGRSSDMRGG
eukprot:926710-Rhodomonas_salina.1